VKSKQYSGVIPKARVFSSGPRDLPQVHRRSNHVAILPEWIDRYGLIVLMREVTISGFKANCSALLNQVQKTKQPLRVTRFGTPIAEIVPVAPQPSLTDWFGSMKGSVVILGDIISPANEEQDWEVLRD
jgi:prevent-host-death family protein